MRTRSNKKKKDLQNACCSVKPKNRKINEYKKSSNRKLFQNGNSIIETVNLIDDSDEENTQKNVVSSLQASSDIDKSGQDVEMKNNESTELKILNSPVSLNLEQSCFILTDTTLSENTLRFQNEKLEECGSSTPTTKHELVEPSHSKDIKQVIESRPSENIITHEVNIHNEELSNSEQDYRSFLASLSSTENDCINDDSDIVFVSQMQNAGNNIENSVIVIEDDDVDDFKNFPKKKRRKLRRQQRRALNRMQAVQQNHGHIKNLNTCDNISESMVLNRIGLREIVIDGSNIAFGHSNGEYFSVRGLFIAIQYFLKKGHKVTAFVPQFRLKVGESSSPAFLQELADKRYVIFTPSREVLGKRITPYDDRFIIQYAHIKEAIVVSNDNYRDLLLEKPEWQSTIENRLLMYTWVEDLLIFPEDPLGRKGPPLSDFLKFP